LKVREVEHPTLGKQVQFWCAGCGQFHEAPASLWNGDQEKPTLSLDHHPKNLLGQPCIVIGEYLKFGDGKCEVLMEEGRLFWADSCRHRLAGQSRGLQNEEAWREGIPWDAKLEGPPKVMP
jgi:hypothetical protein